MTTLRKFVAKKPKKVEVDERQVDSMPEVFPEYGQKYSRPRELFLLYAAIQRKHGKWVVPYGKDQRMRTCFQRLKKKIDAFAELGIEIDDVAYIEAHKATYGKELHPTHLISWCSYNIYQSYLTEQHADVMTLTDDEQKKYDDEIILYLADLRGESKEDVVQLLQSCDLL